MVEATPIEIRRAAMDLLARREHSFQELTQKLCRRFSDSELIEEQVYQLSTENLQSDQRYLETFVRSRIRKGQGPLRIINELNQKGVSKSQVLQYIEAENIDWDAVLKTLCESKYANTPIQDEKEKAKRMRFFQYRGFSIEQIMQILPY